MRTTDYLINAGFVLFVFEANTHSTTVTASALPCSPATAADGAGVPQRGPEPPRPGASLSSCELHDVLAHSLSGAASQLDGRSDTAPHRRLGGGSGLDGLRERIEQAGGRMSAGPTADGWRVEIEVPA